MLRRSHGSKYKVLDDIRALYKSEGKAIPKEMDSTVYYNRGLMWAALHLKAIENALKAKGGGKITGADVAKGFEMIDNFLLGGILPPLKVTPEDHEGGGWVQIFQVKGQGFVPVTDWMHGYRDVVLEMVAKGE